MLWFLKGTAALSFFSNGDGENRLFECPHWNTKKPVFPVPIGLWYLGIDFRCRSTIMIDSANFGTTNFTFMHSKA